MFVHRDPPEDPVNVYLDQQKTDFINSLPVKPNSAFRYAVTPTTTGSNGATSLTFSVTNTDATKTSQTKINSLIVKFTVGQVAENLFAPPSGKDSTTNGPTTNIVTYTIGNGSGHFVLSGTAFPGSGDNTMTLKIQGTDGSDGSVLDDSGLSFTIVGVGNAIAGSATITINESATNRPDGLQVPAVDVQQSLTITKS